MHVLILEDNLSLCRLYMKILTHHQYTVDAVDTCAAALDRLTQITPDIVLVDMELPDGSGLMIIDYMRHDARFNASKIIAITGDEKYQKAGNFRADMFLLKPVSTRLLYALLDRAAAGIEQFSRKTAAEISGYQAYLSLHAN